MNYLLKAAFKFSVIISILYLNASCSEPEHSSRIVSDFSGDWKFKLADAGDAFEYDFDDSGWENIDLPHDWSIHGEFSGDHPAGTGGGALPGGIGWYRKTFFLSEMDSSKNFFIEFDGIYRDSDVWINGHFLGNRPNGYISFGYELTGTLNFGQTPNIISVKVDNSLQPNSRWYSGSGIYRNVRLVSVNDTYLKKWGAYLTTESLNSEIASVNAELNYMNKSNSPEELDLITVIEDHDGLNIYSNSQMISMEANSENIVNQQIKIHNPQLWSVDNPYLYKATFSIFEGNDILDSYSIKFGIRTFEFDPKEGFILNNEKIKIRGVCNHHDLGALGAAVNKRALERQLELLKGMGVNGIRTAHNPPAPELLELCDKMGFIVMDEIFDVWKKKKTEYDYSIYWDEWHERDLKDFILRDRNHPSVFVWSVGNEVLEQWDHNNNSGSQITSELVSIVKSLDDTRPVTAACNNTDPQNPLLRSNALDLIGFNYNHSDYTEFPELFPSSRLIATETVSSLHTRGSYHMPSDKIRRWPKRWDIPFTDGHPELTCSAYDNSSTPWGSTHKETWDAVKNSDHVSGMFIWTGFDYLGEPTPYSWPARSSYFGLIDLAGFPKDAYYFYQSEWSEQDVLHIFPHWNWEEGQEIDLWAYTNCTEVELFLNNESMGVKAKSENDSYLVWKLKYTPGILKAVGKTRDDEIIAKEIYTASEPYQISLTPDREFIDGDGRDLSFVKVSIHDKEGNLVPYADNLVEFSIEGVGSIVGVDNGLQTSLESFKSNSRKAFNGLCLAIIQARDAIGKIDLTARSEGLLEASVSIYTK